MSLYVVFWAVFAFGLAASIAAGGRRGRREVSATAEVRFEWSHPFAPIPPPDPVAALRAAYVRGDIEADEFERLLGAALERGQSPRL